MFIYFFSGKGQGKGKGKSIIALLKSGLIKKCKLKIANSFLSYKSINICNKVDSKLSFKKYYHKFYKYH